jgi:hypothetical protein
MEDNRSGVSFMKYVVKAAMAVALLPSAFLMPPAVLAQSGSKASSADSEKLVCRKVAETGSLVKKTKVCLTRAQWSRSSENHQKYGEELQDGLRTRPCIEPPCT